MNHLNVISIILLNFIVYFRTLRYDVVIDDNCRKYHVKDLPKSYFKRIFRLTRYSGYGGIPIPLDHLLTILLHTTTCVAIYFCLGSNTLSFITALLFSVHPVNNQVSIWLNGKRFAVTTILILLAWGFKPYGLIFYFISPIWHYAGLPLILLYTEYWWIWCILIVPIIFHRKIINKIGSRWERIPAGEIKRIRPRKLVLLVKMLGYHFLHCLLPRRMSFYHMFMERFGFSDEDNKYWYSFNKDFWIGLILTIVIIMLIIINWGNPIGFGLFWWLIFILPWCQCPTGITQAIAERNQYLPLVGLLYALCYALRSIPYPDLSLTLIVALMTYYGTKLWYYMPAYRNVEEFYRYAIFEFPDHFRARAHVINRELQENRVFWALKDAGIGLRHNPKDCTLNVLMAQSLMAVGAWVKAKEYLEKAKANLIPGQEKHFLDAINQFTTIIDDQIKNPRPIKFVREGEPLEIKPSQIAGGQR